LRLPPYYDSDSYTQTFITLRPNQSSLLIFYQRAGLTLTQGWTTANSLDTKVELEDKLAKGMKAEIQTNYLPASNKYGVRTNLYFKQPNFHGRAFFDLIKGPTATVDAVLGHEGALVGVEAAYDVQKAAITRYSAALGYSMPQYSAAVTATNNLSVFSASYYHKVNSQVEAGAKAVWDSKAGNNVGLEVASKYRIDPASFAKACIRIDLGVNQMTNYHVRPRSTTVVSPPLPTTLSSAQASPLASVPPLTPRSSTKLPTR
jgi:voltage-dependent anion channel protein 2